VKLGYVKQTAWGRQIILLQPRVHFNRSGLCIIHGFGTEKIVRCNWRFIITKFHCIFFYSRTFYNNQIYFVQQELLYSSIWYLNNIHLKGEKPGLVVRAEDSHPRGHGFEPRHILDGCKQFASYYIKEKLKKM
jgi:hypothetical protein